MKKIIYILVFAIILTSCNNEGTKRQDGSWLISSIDVNEKITGLMGMYYNVIDANIIAIPQGFLKPKKYLVEVTFEKNSFEFPTSEIFNPKKYTYTIDRIRVDSLDNEKYYSFVERCRAEGIDVPIIPGIKPVVFKNQLTVLPKIFRSDIPEPFAAELRKCKNDDEVKAVGVEWCIQQCKDLIAHGVPSLHFYTMMASDSVYKVAKEVY